MGRLLYFAMMKRALLVCCFFSLMKALFSQSLPPPQSIPSSDKGSSVSGGASAVPDSGGKVLSLDACVGAALASSDDIAMADRSLDSARAQHALNASKDAVSLQATGGYGFTDGFGNASILKSSLSGSALGLVQSVQGGLTVQKGTLSSANPATKIALTATQNLPSPDSSVGYSTTVVGVSVAQTIWDGYPGGQTKASVDKSFLALRIKELQTVQSRAAAVAAVKRAYITMLTAQRALDVKKSIADKQRGLLKQIETVYSLKQASSVDLLNAQINSESADLDVESGSHGAIPRGRLERRRLRLEGTRRVRRRRAQFRGLREG